jgi:chaperonin cofactor prefoldin
MQTMRLAAGFLLVLAVGQVILIHAQSPQASGGSGDELVKEVRLMRLFLESSQREINRREVVLQRYRIQHDIVASVTERLETVRDELATINNEINQAVERATELQSNVDAAVIATTDPERKAQIDLQVSDTRTRLQDLRARQTRLQEQESRLSASFNAENAKFRVLEQTLDTLIAP